MSGNKNTGILLMLLAFLAAGCTHYAAFPDLEEQGTLAADEQNIAYDDSVDGAAKKGVDNSKKTEYVSAAPVAKVKAETLEPAAKTAETISQAPKPEEKLKKAENKKEQAKDLTKPNPAVAELPDSENSEIVLSKSTPAVISDMDLTEMDRADKKTSKVKTADKKRASDKTQPTSNSEPSVFYLAETVYFSDGGSAVETQYQNKLRNVVKEAKKHNGKIIVQGFASSRTRNTDIVTHKMANMKVSVARAENVAALLAQYGMPKNRIITEGLSDSRPVYQEVMPEGERLNRRAEIYISY